MTNISKNSSKTWIRRRLRQIGVESLEKRGWKVTTDNIYPLPSGSRRGTSVRRITKNGESKLITIRTSQDKWIAFPRTDDDTKWVTLCDVEVVVAVVVDDTENPRSAQVHMIDANEMRDRFDRAYAARRAADHTIPMKRGVWLSLYEEEGTSPVQRVGAGAGLANPAIAVVPLGESDAPVAPTTQPNSPSDYPPTRYVQGSASVDEQPLTIAEAKTKLALTFGVDPSNIKITVEA